MKTPIYVIGHRNPDTDSVCSAVCYARFKTIITGECYIPKRAGHLNEETQFVFKNLGIKPPEYMHNVRPQVKDVDIHFVDGVDENISIIAYTFLDLLDHLDYIHVYHLNTL